MSKPSFKALFEEYAATLSARDPATISEFVDDDVKIHFKGNEKEAGLHNLKSFFVKEWARPDARVSVKEVVELPGEDAVLIRAVDHNDGDKVVSTTYHYTKKGGKWVISKLDTEYNYWG